MLSWLLKLFGSGSVWKWVALAAMAAAVGWLLLVRAGLRAELAETRAEVVAVQADRAQALAAYQTAQEALTALRESNAATVQALAARDAETRRLSAERNQFQRAWKEALRNEQVRSWADTPVPADVRGLLR